jgi:predicted bacteriocin transport accessory protein
MENNKKIVMMISTIFLFALLGCFYYLIVCPKESHMEANQIYKNISSMTVESFEKKIYKSDSIFVYIGSLECPDCLDFEGTLLEIIDSYEFTQEIHFLDLTWLRKENKEKYKKIKEQLGFSQIPNFCLIENGKVISKIEWTDKGLLKSDVVDWLKNNNLIE